MRKQSGICLKDAVVKIQSISESSKIWIVGFLRVLKLQYEQEEAERSQLFAQFEKSWPILSWCYLISFIYVEGLLKLFSGSRERLWRKSTNQQIVWRML